MDLVVFEVQQAPADRLTAGHLRLNQRVQTNRPELFLDWCGLAHGIRYWRLAKG